MTSLADCIDRGNTLHIGPEPPDTAGDCDLWFDCNTGAWNWYFGGAWVPIPGASGGLPPGGVEDDLLVKQSAVNGDAIWGNMLDGGSYP